MATVPTNPLYTGISLFQDSQISNISASISSVAGSVSALSAKQAQDVADLYSADQFNKNFLMARISDESSSRNAQHNLLKERVDVAEPKITTNTANIATVSGSLQALSTKQAEDVAMLQGADNFNKAFLMDRVSDEATTRFNADTALSARLSLVEPIVSSHTASIASLTSGLSQAVAKELADINFLSSVDVLIKTEVNKIIATDNFQSTLLSQTASKNDVYSVSGAMYNFLQIFLQTYQIKNAQNEVMTIDQLWNPSISMPNAPTYNNAPFPEVNLPPPVGGVGFA
jgi:hypothetical protein